METNNNDKTVVYTSGVWEVLESNLLPSVWISSKDGGDICRMDETLNHKENATRICEAVNGWDMLQWNLKRVENDNEYQKEKVLHYKTANAALIEDKTALVNSNKELLEALKDLYAYAVNYHTIQNSGLKKDVETAIINAERLNK